MTEQGWLGPQKLRRLGDDPAYAGVVEELKSQLAELRAENGDTHEKFPAVKAIVDQFWNFDDADRAKSIEISHEFRRRREQAMQ